MDINLGNILQISKWNAKIHVGFNNNERSQNYLEKILLHILILQRDDTSYIHMIKIKVCIEKLSVCHKQKSGIYNRK